MLKVSNYILEHINLKEYTLSTLPKYLIYLGLLLVAIVLASFFRARSITINDGNI